MKIPHLNLVILDVQILILIHVQDPTLSNLLSTYPGPVIIDSCSESSFIMLSTYPGPVIIDSCTESSFIMLSTYPGPVIINSYLGPALICFRLSRSWNQLKSPSTNHIYLLNNQSIIFHLLSTPVWKKTGNRRVFWVRQKKIKINAYSI